MGFLSGLKKTVRRAGKTAKSYFEDPAAKSAQSQAKFQRNEAQLAAEQTAKDTVTQAGLMTEQANAQLGSSIAMLGKAGALGLKPSGGAGPTGITIGEGVDTSSRKNINDIFGGLGPSPTMGGGADFATGMSLTNLSTFRDQLSRDRMSLVEAGQKDAMTQMRNRDMFESQRKQARKAGQMAFAKNIINTGIQIGTMAATGGLSAAGAGAAGYGAMGKIGYGLLGAATGNVYKPAPLYGASISGGD